MFTWTTFLEEIFVSPLQPRVARRKQARAFPASVTFFAISSRNRSWKTQKWHAAMLWAFSIRSSIREASATSIMGGLGTWTSHERAEDLLQVGAPFLLRLRRDGVPLDLSEAVAEFRQEPVPVRGGHVRRGRPDLVVGHRDDLLERPRPDE